MNVLFRKEGLIGTVTISRPEARNALNEAVRESFTRRLSRPNKMKR